MTVIVQNRYFARAGKRTEALATRRRASKIRARANRPVGRILVNFDTTPDTPDFIWECSYPDLETRKTDAEWAESSPDFKEVQDHMSTLLERFERQVFHVVDGDEG